MSDLVDQLEAAFSGRDPDAFAAFCAPDLHGAHAERLWKGFPDARVERTGERLTSADGRFVAAPVKLVATHRGELDEALPPTGRFLVLHAIFYCELTDDHARLWRLRGFYDVYDAAMQLGVVPKPGTLGEKALLMLRGFGLRAGRG